MKSVDSLVWREIPMRPGAYEQYEWALISFTLRYTLGFCLSVRSYGYRSRIRRSVAPFHG